MTVWFRMASQSCTADLCQNTVMFTGILVYQLLAGVKEVIWKEGLAVNDSFLGLLLQGCCLLTAVLFKLLLWEVKGTSFTQLTRHRGVKLLVCSI